MLAVLRNNFVLAQLVFFLLELHEGMLVVFFVSPGKKVIEIQWQWFIGINALQLRSLADVAINHEEVYAYTNVVREHHEMSFVDITCEITGGKKGGNGLEAICMRVSLCCKATPAYQEARSLLKSRAVHES